MKKSSVRDSNFLTPTSVMKEKQQSMSTMIMPAATNSDTAMTPVENCYEHYTQEYANMDRTSVVSKKNEETTRREFHKRLITSRNNDVNNSHVMDLLQWWCSQRTPESVQKSMELLHYISANPSNQQHQQQQQQKVQTSVVNHVVDNWRLCWKRQQENHDYYKTINNQQENKVDYSSLLVPKQVLKIIENNNNIENINSVPFTIPDTKTYNLILDASVSYMAVRSSQPQLWQNCNTSNKSNYDTKSNEVDETLQIAKDVFNRMYQKNFYSPSLSSPSSASLNVIESDINITTFSTMMRIWNQSREVSGPSEGLKLLRLYQKLYDENPASVNNVPPNNMLYGAVMESYIRQISLIPDGVKIVEELHQEMVKKSNLFPENIYPTTMSMSSVIAAHTKSIDSNNREKLNKKSEEEKDGAAMRAHSLLQQMIEAYQQTRHENIKPDSHCFSLVLWALSKRGMATQAEGLLRTMIELYENDVYERNNGSSSELSFLYPDHSCWTAVQEAYSKTGNVPKSVEICQNIQHYAKITNQNMNLLLQAHAESGNHDSSIEAERILLQMEDYYHKHNNLDMKPTRITYSAVMSCYANSKNMSSFTAQKMEGILNRMEEKYRVQKDDIDLKPNTYMYNTLLNAYARSRNLDDSKIGQIIEMFYKMSQSSSKPSSNSNRKDENVNIRPNRSTYTTLFALFARNPKYQHSASTAQYIFNQMKAEYQMNPEANLALKPTKQQYSLLLSTYANLGDGDAAEQILKEMNDLYEQDPVNNKDCYPCTMCYNQVLSAWSKRSQNNKNRNEVKSKYNKKYQSTTTSDDSMEELLLASNRAERVFTRMQKLANNYNQTNENNNKSNNSHDRIMKESLLPKVEPDIISLGSLLHCYVQSKQCERADQLLYFVQKQYDAAREKRSAKMEEYENNGNCTSIESLSVMKPNRICYNTVIDAWSKMSSELHYAPSRAEKLFREMTHRYEEYDDISFKPDKQTYTSLIHAWYKSSAVQNNRYIPQQQQQQQAHNNNQVLQSKPHMKSQQLLDEMIAKYDHNPGENGDLCPDNYIYTAVMNAWAKHGLVFDDTKTNKTFESQMDTINHIESLFLDMILRYQKMEANKLNSNNSNNNRNLLPDIICINTLLKSYHIVLRNNSIYNNNDIVIMNKIVDKVESMIQSVENEKMLSCQPNRVTLSLLEKIRAYRRNCTDNIGKNSASHFKNLAAA